MSALTWEAKAAGFPHTCLNTTVGMSVSATWFLKDLSSGVLGKRDLGHCVLMGRSLQSLKPHYHLHGNPQPLVSTLSPSTSFALRFIGLVAIMSIHMVLWNLPSGFWVWWERGNYYLFLWSLSSGFCPSRHLSSVGQCTWLFLVRIQFTY